MTRIAQLANFVAPHSGGIRNVLAHLAAGYGERGIEVVQFVPGPRHETRATEWGTLVTLPGRSVPKTGYRVLAPWTVRRALERYAPDHIEVHDRSTLRGLGTWARGRSVGSCVVSHERLDRLLEQWTRQPRLSRALADRSNRALARRFDTVVCTTTWALEEFVRIGARNAVLVPLGVDADMYAPARADADLRARYARPDETLLFMASRLSVEKRPQLAVDTVAELLRRGVRTRLVIAGDGPLRTGLDRRARSLPVRLLGHVADRATIAGLQASADVCLAPGPVETFGLAALEALACGTPVVANAASALPEVLGEAGIAAAGSPAAFADAVQAVLARPADDRRAAARDRAQRYGWGATADGFAAVHASTAAMPAATSAPVREQSRGPRGNVSSSPADHASATCGTTRTRGSSR